VRADGSDSIRSHGPRFYEEVSDMVKTYLASSPDPSLYDFLRYDFQDLNETYGGVVATTFRNFPSFPQRYMEALDLPQAEPSVRVEPVKPFTQPILYTEDDLHIRQFLDSSARRLTRKGRFRAA
jgi:hypothetical protein